MTTPTDFSINGWFNDKGLRILGTSADPYFYAIDLQKLLDIQNIHSGISRLGEQDIVSQATRDRLGLVTYKVWKGKQVRDDKITLLTIRGAYKIILSSRSPHAADIQDYIFTLIERKRATELTTLRTLISDQAAELAATKRKLASYESKVTTYSVYRKLLNGGDPFDYYAPDDLKPDVRPPHRCSYTAMLKFVLEELPGDNSAFELYGRIYDTHGELLWRMGDREPYCLRIAHASAGHTAYFAGNKVEMHHVCDRVYDYGARMDIFVGIMETW